MKIKAENILKYIDFVNSKLPETIKPRSNPRVSKTLP